MKQQLVMRTILAFVTLFSYILFFSSPASALLMRTPVDSTFVVVDDVNNVQWADLNRFTNMIFSEVEAEIVAMNAAGFAGAIDWHLAELAEINQLFAQIVNVGDARKFDRTNFSSTENYVIGRYDRPVFTPDPAHKGAFFSYPISDPDTSLSVTKNTEGPNYGDDFSFFQTGAFVVSTAAPIPEPATMLLLGTGLVGFAVPRIRRKMKK